MVLYQQAIEKEKLEKERHKARTDAIAEKTKNRSLPYGLNYSKVKDLVVEDVDVPLNKTNRIDYDTFQKLANDRTKRNEYLASKSTNKKPARKPMRNERLTMLTNEKLGSKVSYY